MPFVNADTNVAFKGQVSFQGKQISNAEVYFMNPSGGSNAIATYTNSRGEFELTLQGSGIALVSILVPSTGKPEIALGNFQVQLSNNQIKNVYYDVPPSIEPTNLFAVMVPLKVPPVPEICGILTLSGNPIMI